MMKLLSYALTIAAFCIISTAYSQVAKVNSTSGTIFSTGPNHMSRTFTYTAPEFGGCSSLTEVEISINLTIASGGSCGAPTGYAVQEDLNLRLVSPTGTTVDLVQDKWGYWTGVSPQPNSLSSFNLVNNASVLFDDDAATAVGPGGDYGATPVVSPHNPLSAFDGENPAGVWTLHISEGNGQFGPAEFTCFNSATLTVTCGAVAAPEIDIEGSSTSIADGDATPDLGDDTDFGSAVIGASPTNTFTIQNEGTSDLTLSGGPNFVTLTGSSMFAVTSQPTGTIAAGGSTTFDIQFTPVCPNAAGTYTATVSVSSDDADESPYTFVIEGTITGVDTDSDGILNDCDSDDDNDGVADASDPDDADFNICGDSDGDGCDDCSVTNDGFGALSDSDPSDDGLDTDCDGICDATDGVDDASLIRGNMLTFGGAADYVSLGDISDLDFGKTDDFTIEAWINTTANADIDIISKYGGLFGTGWVFQHSTANGSLAFVMQGGLIDMFMSGPTGAPVVADGEWHHVAVTYDGSNLATGCTFYVDGVAYAGTALGGLTGPIVGTVTNSHSATIGAYEAGGPAEFWDGSMDEVRVWDDERSQTEIRQGRHLTFSGACMDDLDGYWKFNSGSGTAATDYSGNGNDGAFVGAPVSVASEASVGYGVATTHAATATATNYTSSSLYAGHEAVLNFASTPPGGEIVVTYINELPVGGLPAGALLEFRLDHWIVDNYGPTNSGLDGTFHFDYEDGGVTNTVLANYRFHKRGSNETGPWIENNSFADAASTVPGDNHVDFSGITGFSMFFASSGISPLPVELINFNATKEGDQVNLILETASEHNNKGFRVLHSVDGENWTEIEFIDGVGTSDAMNAYSTVHRSPSVGVNYYQLEQVDFDLQSEYSDIRAVEFRNVIKTIKVVPNPNNGKFMVLSNSGFNGETSIELVDAQGTIVYREEKEVSGNSISIDVTDLNSGLYILRVSDQSTVQTDRIVVK